MLDGRGSDGLRHVRLEVAQSVTENVVETQQQVPVVVAVQQRVALITVSLRITLLDTDSILVMRLLHYSQCCQQ